MTKELRDLIQLAERKKAEAREKINSGDLESAKALKKEIIEINDKISILSDLEVDQKKDIENKITDVVINKTSQEEDFIRNLKNGYKGIVDVNTVKEGVDENGGFVVPRDVSTSINKLLREKNSLKELVTVEKVNTFEGSRVFEVNAKHTPFDKVEEEAIFGDVATPTFKSIPYKCSKYGGILKASAEILEDSTENIINYLTGWISDKMVATYNGVILQEANKVLNSATAIKTYDDIKTILNTKIDPALKKDTIILTNQSGYNWLDTLKDKNDNYLLKPLITDPTVKSVEGKIAVAVITDEELPNSGKKIPFYIGNFKEFIRIFDRNVYSVETSRVAGDLWSKDRLGMKVRTRFDIKVIDDKAVVKGEFTPTSL